MNSTEALETLELTAAHQWGIISTAQAEQEGISRLQISRLSKRGILQRARHGIYYLPSIRNDQATEVKAAWIALEPGTFVDDRWNLNETIAVSHESAARLHNIGTLIPAKHYFSASHRKQTTQPDITVYSNRTLLPEEIVNMDGLPVTSIERTISDLAATHIERNYLADLVADGLRREGVSFESVARALKPHAHAYGCTTSEELVQELQAEAVPLEEQLDQMLSALHFAENLVRNPSRSSEHQKVASGKVFEFNDAFERAVSRHVALAMEEIGKKFRQSVEKNISLQEWRVELTKAVEYSLEQKHTNETR
ncbi:Uncharacterised protein [Corynebacterium renale]|uniref:type IV toxin-antitoxin system AbiEi family antitoxin domain-containing protein n=1 Tax=Corynebacterium renale TaxID=1724 RepID=UPI000DA26B3B|nr:type IV toxin-antitoxin system AbiEi family antitoxin domain-containing protein [Corynebacterium renale]SQG63509.1 Uncharacterised protein [Corynebacterium renale]STD00525.1 Uncharacterised protein [Corynebacterium renale]